ncbi:MAG TPA: hypothetical protein ENF32_06245 [Thermosulfidibacter takaii]|uniref:DUF8156 domain-containing protein n=1 Tax=Thermosulfidibacter takaii TaxID=412593 RepID=A0A7C0Y9F0_9BACT|nr:hypothetical protein [Thermosulfidibacter takaii]
MGRTVVSYNSWVAQEKEGWSKFRRALRKEDREALDRLFDYAKLHAAEAGYAARLYPFETLLIAMLLEHEKKIQELERRLATLEGRR